MVDSNDDGIILNNLLKGQITINDIRAAMSKIPSPVDQKKPEGVFKEITKSEPMRRVLAVAMGSDIENFSSVNVDYVVGFLAKFPMPMDFDEKTKDFLKKYPNYVEAVKALRAVLYGDRQAYWDKIQRLNALAAEMREKKEAEAAFGNSGAFSVSKNEVETGNAGDSADAFYESDADGFFAVFDGAGEDGHDATQMCTRGIRRALRQYYVDSVQNLFFVANELDVAVKQLGGRGFAAGTLVKVLGEGNAPRKMIFVAVGNVRLYVMRKGKVFQMTQDESNGSVVTNAFGAPNYAAAQGGELDLEYGDRLLICTDGVTGVEEAERLSNAEIAAVLAAMPNDQIAAQRLAKIARRVDDRTLIVKTIR